MINRYGISLLLIRRTCQTGYWLSWCPRLAHLDWNVGVTHVHTGVETVETIRESIAKGFAIRNMLNYNWR